VVAVDLPCDDDSAGFSEYTETVVRDIGDRTGLIVVEWWANTGYAEAVRAQAERDGRPSGGEFDPREVFFHDVPPAVVEEAFARGEKAQSGPPFEMPWPLEHWPEVPTRFLLCRDDRFFPAEFLRRVVVERLGIVPDEMGGGHLPALGRPKELASRLEAYRVG